VHATARVDRAAVNVFAPRGAPGTNCARVLPLARRVAKPAVLTGAMRALVAGPTTSERARGYGGWFSARTAGSVRSVRISRQIAYVDFRDFSRLIPNASSSCGSAMPSRSSTAPRRSFRRSIAPCTPSTARDAPFTNGCSAQCRKPPDEGSR
jgi:hypothetical protein